MKTLFQNNLYEKAIQEASRKYKIKNYRIEKLKPSGIKTLLKFACLLCTMAKLQRRNIFEKNILLLSNVIETANGKTQTNSETKRNSTGYGVTTKKETKTIIHKGITNNLSKIYFEEPLGIKLIWSDSFGEMLTLKPAGEHRYELILPNGKSSFYSYIKGICTLVETEIVFGKLTFTLTK